MSTLMTMFAIIGMMVSFSILIGIGIILSIIIGGLLIKHNEEIEEEKSKELRRQIEETQKKLQEKNTMEFINTYVKEYEKTSGEEFEAVDHVSPRMATPNGEISYFYKSKNSNDSLQFLVDGPRVGVFLLNHTNKWFTTIPCNTTNYDTSVLENNVNDLFERSRTLAPFSN